MKSLALLCSLLVLEASMLQAMEPPAPITDLDIPVEDGGEAKADEPRQRDALSDAILHLKFPRSPAEALAARASALPDDPRMDATQKAALSFERVVQAGDWVAMGRTIAALPKASQDRVFLHVVGRLGDDEAVILPGDVLAIAANAPGGLDESRIAALGSLLAGALRLVEASGPLVADLERGVAGIGGATSEGRRRAAALLLAANHVIEAGSFLPALAEAERGGDLDTIDLHARYCLALAKERQDVVALAEAWRLTTSLLDRLSSDTAPERQALRVRAVQRGFELLERVPPTVGARWLDRIFRERPAQGRLALATVGLETANAFNAKQPARRQSALELQRRVVEALTTACAGDLPAWRSELDLLALGWLGEIKLAIERSGGNDQDNSYKRRRNDDEREPLSAEVLLATAPGNAWADACEPALAQRLRLGVAGMIIRSGDQARSLELIAKLAVNEPQRAARLAADLLTMSSYDTQTGVTMNQPQWRQNMTRQQMMTYQRQHHAWQRWQQQQRYGQSGDGIPLTRARQVQRLKELSGLLAQLRRLPLPPLDQNLVVGAFTACHSDAEVFREEDITAVLGQISDLAPGTSLNLASTMRERLGGIWRQPQTQQQQGTRRTDDETAAEVARGYELATRLVARVAEGELHSWMPLAMSGLLRFDQAEFLYGRKADLATYTTLRDGAFAAFEQAATAYAALHDPDQPDADVFTAWFRTALGASDLGNLTRQSEPDGDQMGKLRNALLALTDSDRHFLLFAEALTASLGEVSGELKLRYLRNALRVIGDHGAGAGIRRIVTGYDQLLAEIVLVAAVDGDQRIGTAPFGVRLGLQHSAALGRESGGFSRYLSNQVYTSQGQVDLRNTFEKHLREVLGERFTVLGVSWHEPSVQPHGIGRDGWRETPFAYLVLKAKDAAVDRLPALRLDLDFSDRHGPVVLPTLSSIQAVDASSAVARPASAIRIEQVLDPRGSGDGTLVLDLALSARGLPPAAEHALVLDVPGFERVSIADQGVVLGNAEVTDAGATATTSQRWRVSYRRSDAAVSSFRFPAATSPVEAMVFKLDRDGDRSEATATVAIEPLTGWRWWPWMVAAALIVLGAIAIAWRLRRRVAVASNRPRHPRPERLTPFTTLAWLRQLAADPGVALGEAERGELQAVINALEQAHFARAATPAPDLHSVVERWHPLAQR